MNERELNRERRRQRAFERLGSNHPRCVTCGHDDPLALEQHHIAGRAFDDETVPICRNCHRRLSDWQKDHAVAQAKPGGELASIARFLDGVADLFEMLVKRLREFAVRLAAMELRQQAHGEEARP